MDLKTFYVTFGAGTFFANYYQEIQAYNEDVVRVYMNKHYPNIWSMVYTKVPQLSAPLFPPRELFYQSAEHI